MNLLVTNDDGIDAPGLAALEQAARQLGRVTVVAPRDHVSACSHQATTHRPLCVSRHGDGRYAVDGFPADCARVGLIELAKETRWVLSGINAGGNLGADVYHSGTVAAVREAVLLGRPGIALSHYRKRGMDYDWNRASRWIAAILRDLMDRPWKPGTFWNVNLPHLNTDDPDPEVIECPLDSNPLHVQFRREGDHLVYEGDYHGRPRNAGSDVDMCFSGKIAVSLLRLG